MSPSRPILHEFPYRPNVLGTTVLLVLACGGALVCGYFAIYAQSGARSARGIELTRDQFRLATGIVAICSPIGISALALHLRNACRNRRRVAFTAETFIVPADGLSHTDPAEIELPLRNVIATSVEHLLDNDYVLLIDHRDGTTRLLSERFARRRDFDRVVALLAETNGTSARS